MPLSDLPQSVLFIAFLLVFVLVGVYPTWKKTAQLIRNALQKSKQQHDNGAVPAPATQVEADPAQHLSAQLSDFEIFVLKRLAQNPRKPLSRRQINAELHLEPAMLKTALNSLLRRGLIQISIGTLSGIRFQLSASGTNYAIEQGFIPRLHAQ